MPGKPPPLKLDIYRYVAAFILVSVVIGITGYSYYVTQRNMLVGEIKNMLSSIADLKTYQIVQWRKERMGDASAIYDNQIISGRINDYLEGRNPVTARRELLAWMASLQKAFDYNRVEMFTPNGTPLLSAPDASGTMEPFHRASIEKTGKLRKILFDDFHTHDGMNDAHLAIFVPVLRSDSTSERCIAVIMLSMVPQDFLYPLVQSWPIPNKTAETLLVRREGDHVLFLNELRHQRNTALRLRLPLSSRDLPAVRAVLGQEGVFEGTDYRGVRVLSALQTIPGSPWALVSKVDTQEIYAPIQKRAFYIMVIVLCAIASSGSLIYLAWSRQRLEYLNRQYETEHEFRKELEHRVEVRTLELANMVKVLKGEVSEREKAELALKQETAERLLTVEQLRENERSMIQQNRHTAMGEMISNIAHQWRQPLNTLGMVIQRLQIFHDMGEFSKELLDTSAKEAMRLIQQMSKTIDDFSIFLNPGKEIVAFKVNEMVRQVVSHVEANFKHQQISIAVQSEDEPLINGYPDDYSQAILNILLNARDAFAERAVGEARIRLRSCVEDGMTVVTITDNAGGIPENIMDRIFDPHFTTKGPKGAGIGLFMAKNIVERNMNGRLTARNTADGTEFRIEI